MIFRVLTESHQYSCYRLIEDSISCALEIGFERICCIRARLPQNWFLKGFIGDLESVIVRDVSRGHGYLRIFLKCGICVVEVDVCSLPSSSCGAVSGVESEHTRGQFFSGGCTGSEWQSWCTRSFIGRCYHGGQRRGERRAHSKTFHC